MAEKRFVPITRKVNTIILLSLIAGIGAVTFYFARSLSSTIDTKTEDNLSQQSEVLYSSIETIMLPGFADLAEGFVDDIATIDPDYEILLYRRTGVEAFVDNETISRVNERLGSEVFTPRRDVREPRRLDLDSNFRRATDLPARQVSFRHEFGGVSYIRLYKPLLNIPNCTRCHGSDHTVRGVIDIRNNISDAVRSQRNAGVISAGLFFSLVVVLGLLLTVYLRRTVIAPVQRIGEVCSGVTTGDFTRRVTATSNDEIGRLGSTVNTMVEGLYERYELSKFVSSSTLRSLGQETRGQSARLTLLFSDIRGFTAFAESQDPRDVVSHLNSVLNFQTEIIHDFGGDVDKYVGDEIVAIFSDDEQEICACRAALAIQAELRENSAVRYGGLNVGIGINTGSVILGMIGSQSRADFTVIGDNVNTASRLCSAARPLEIVVSTTVFDAVSHEFGALGPYRLRVKGKVRDLRVYKLKSPGVEE
jgi:class 3 adenylate cyclase